MLTHTAAGSIRMTDSIRPMSLSRFGQFELEPKRSCISLARYGSEAMKCGTCNADARPIAKATKVSMNPSPTNRKASG